MQLDKPDNEFLYINSLPAGIGSNDIGLVPRPADIVMGAPIGCNE